MLSPLGLTQTVTYNEHIAPLLYNNCVKCHRPNQVAPFSLLTYDDATRHGRDMVIQTQSHYMPPWKPEPGWAAYRDERRLTTDQIALIKQWADGGMPQGDPAKTPLLPTFNDNWQLGTPDLILELPQTFNVPADGPDIYRNFVIPSGVTEDKYVTAVEVKPLARSVVHHMLFFTDTTGGARSVDGKDGQPGFPGFGTIFTIGDPLAVLNGGLGSWVPGATPAFLPSGLGMQLPRNADVLVQIHFHPNGVAQKEKSVIGLYFGPRPDRTLTQLQVPAFFGSRANIDIPAGETNYKLRGSSTLPADVDAVSVSAHAHYLAKEAKLTATLPSGEVRILLWIRQWDFNWQDFFIFQDLVPLPKGTRLDGELTYDNSSNNSKNPNSPPKRIKWGENSTDEMGSLILNVVPKVASDIDPLHASTIVAILSPVPLVGNRPLLVSSGVVDGASTQPGAVTPGKIVVLYGANIGPTSVTQSTPAGGGKISTSLANTQVLFDGVPAPLLYASSTQVMAIVPYGIDGKAGTQMQVKNGSLSSDLVALPVAQAAPSIFSVNLTGTGPAAVLNQDGMTVNSSTNPAPRGSVISIYATGEGQTSPAGVDGLVASGTPLPRPTRAATVRIDGQPAEVQYAGAAPGQVAGLMQVNVRIPAGVSSGDVPIEIQVGDAKSQPGMTIAIK
ncbi:MAG TPA: IPT/TIG domain-containing protein [Candidatus Acidoferrum sp.]|nr:IPT/TIG domain-containing protein [Candidatus Acidoferrum sp.]